MPCKIKDLAIGTFAFSVSAVAFTEFSRSYSINDMSAFRETFYKSVFTVWFVIVPVSAYFFFFGDSLIALLFRRGAFDNESAVNSYRVLQALSVGLFAWSGAYFTHKAFYSLHDTVTPMLVSIPNTFIVIALYYFLAKWLSVFGIALALSIVAIWCSSIHLLVFAYKHIKLDLKTFPKKLVTFALLSLVCFGSFRYSLNKYSTPSQDGVWVLFAKVSIAFAVPMLLYIGISYFMKIPEAAYIVNYAASAKDRIRIRIGKSQQ